MAGHEHIDEARLRESEERIRRWAFYEYTSEDTVAVKSPLSTFTAGDLRMVLDALSAERERGDRAVWVVTKNCTNTGDISTEVIAVYDNEPAATAQANQWNALPGQGYEWLVERFALATQKAEGSTSKSATTDDSPPPR